MQRQVLVALAVTCGALSSGCVFPVVNTTSLPKIESRLPTDLLSSGDEVLVVQQISTSSSTGVLWTDKGRDWSSAITAAFTKGSDLPSLRLAIKASTEVGFIAGVPIPPNGGIPLGGALSSERLEKLCVVTQDGRLVALFGVTKELPLLDAGRRDAIVAALRAGGSNPFVGVDGPCGVTGAVEWSTELRSRVTDFLVRLPATAPTFIPSVEENALVRNDLLAAVIRNSWTAENRSDVDKSGAMLLISGVWRGVVIAEYPRFLTAEDFDRFSTSKVTVDANAIISFLPTYTSGLYDPANVWVQSFCLISRDGRAISVVGPTYLESPNARPRKTEWRGAALSALQSGSGKFDPEFPCIPPDMLSWSDVDRVAAVHFLKAIRRPTGVQ